MISAINRLSELLQSLQTWSEKALDPNAKALFKKALLVWFLIQTIQILPYHAQIWGKEGLFPRNQHPPGFTIWSFIDALSIPSVQPFYPAFLFLQTIGILIALFGRGGPWLTLLIWFLSVNLYNSSGPLNDGGNNLAQLLLLYFVVVDFGIRIGRGFYSRLAVAFGNFAWLASKLQVCAVYLTAGTLKVQGDLWQKGMTLYYLARSDSFGHPLMKIFADEFPTFLSLVTYMVMAFQIAFPLFVWRLKARPYLIGFGILLHLGIAFGMGLLTFGLIMCVSYVLWVPDEVAAKMLAKLRSVLRIRAHVAPATSTGQLVDAC